MLSGMTTQFCVLAMAFVGIQTDFRRVILLEDCIASHVRKFHQILMETFGDTVLFPLIKACSLLDWEKEIEKMF